PVGTYAITAMIADPSGLLSNYNVQVNSGTLTLTPASLIVTAADVSRMFGDDNPQFTGTISGLQNNDVITASYSTIATPSSPGGTYAITPTLNGPSGQLSNYAVMLNDGTLTVIGQA